MTMTNAEWMIKNGIQFKKVGRRPCYNPEFESIGYYDINDNFNECYVGKCLGDLVSDSILAWLDMEHKEPILDDAERAYLSAVIKPFRDRVKHICKVNFLGVSSSEYQYIFITLSDGSYNIDLPIFKGDTMYKGMKPAKDYTPQELGL